MRCSNCSAPVRPIVAIDVDGTLGDYHAHFIEFAAEYVGASETMATGYDGAVNFGDWICSSFDIDRRIYRDIKLAYRQGAQKRSMPVYNEAANIVASIRRDAEIWIATSRPYLRLDNIDPDTREWLRRNEIEFDHLIYGDRKYQQLAELVDHERVAAVLDDLGERYDEAAVRFGCGVPILRRTNWNRAVQRDNVACGLVAAHEMIDDQLRSWYASKETVR